MFVSRNSTLTRTPVPGLHDLARLGAGLTSALPALWETLFTWQERASQRRHLASLDDRLLRDVGITPSQALEEANKPFWIGESRQFKRTSHRRAKSMVL